MTNNRAKDGARASGATSYGPQPSPNGRVRPPEPKAERFPLVTSAALASQDYRPSWIIKDMLVAGSPAVDGGFLKTGKTLIAVDGAISVASATQFLGRFEVPEPLAVVYFSGEGGPSVAQEYGQRIAASKGLELGKLSKLHWCFTVPKLDDIRDLDEIQRLHDKTGADMMVFDNLMLCLSGDDAGNVFKMGHILGAVIRVCNERGITPLFVHHFKRTRATVGQYDPGELADLTQAGAAEIAGQWWLLARRRPYSPDHAGEHELWLTVGGRLGHSSLHGLDVHEGRLSDPGGRRWEVDVLSAGDVRESEHQRAQEAKDKKRADKVASELEDTRKAIVEALTTIGRPESMTEIRRQVGGGHAIFDRAWKSLIQKKTVKTAGMIRKGNGQEYPAFALDNGGLAALLGEE